MNSEGDSFLTLTWPDFYPADCPPAEAESASGTVYRLVKHDPARAEDFKSVFEENLRGVKEKQTVNLYGLSVHRDSQDRQRATKEQGQKIQKQTDCGR